MDPIEKLLQRVSRKDRERLFETLSALQRGEIEGLKLLKLKGSDSYRVRVGRFRIQVLLKPKTKQVEVLSVKWRNEKTYK